MQNTEVIPGQYNIKTKSGCQLNALRNKLMECLCQRRFRKAIQVCDVALSIEYDVCWASVRSTLLIIA